ncbi:MAG: peptide chain release factor 1 [Ruminococcaceae bacterium]|nr:peptide chain release factor 1 [Oscillospiraceae bacterium]
MFEQLASAEMRYEQMDARLSSPDLMKDPAAYASFMKEYRALGEIVSVYRNYRQLVDAEKEALELMQAGDDDLKVLAKEELRSVREQLPLVIEQLQILLLPKDPLDEKNVIVEIRACAGGEEAALFAAVLYRMYGMYADKKGFKMERLSANETELGGYREITFSVDGEGAYSRLKFESGVHRVQRVPETESQGRIQTSTVTVAVLPEADEICVQINPADLVIESCKSSGAGGQHINKTESAVRILHKPSGIVVECQEERSQFKNKDKALRMLSAKLFDIKSREQNERIAADRRSQVGTGDRSERIRTYNYPQGRVTDHRIGLTLYDIESVVNGELDKVIDPLIAAKTAEDLKNGKTEF